MAEKPGEVDVEADEVMVTQMDTCAFLSFVHGIEPNHKGSMTMQHNPSKLVAYWVYKRTPKIEKALADWAAPPKDVTRIPDEDKTAASAGFRNVQLKFRNEKVRLERGG